MWFLMDSLVIILPDLTGGRLFYAIHEGKTLVLNVALKDCMLLDYLALEGLACDINLYTHRHKHKHIC